MPICHFTNELNIDKYGKLTVEAVEALLACCLWFFVPPSENKADQKLYIAPQKWLAKTMESDPKITIIPRYNSDLGEDTIKSFKDMSTSLFLFKKYCQRANPNGKGGKVYTGVF